MSTVSRALRHPGTWLGFLGSILLVFGAYGSNGVPQNFTDLPGFHSWFMHLRGRGRNLVFLGVLALAAAFAWLQPRRTRRPVNAWVPFVLWVAPLLIAPAIVSRAAYTFLDFGYMQQMGYYARTLPAGSAGGPWRWVADPQWSQLVTSSPGLLAAVYRYVPVVLGQHVVMTVLSLRLFPLAGALMMGWGVSRLARRFGRDVDAALWVTLLNPLLIVGAIGEIQVAIIGAGFALVAAEVAYRRGGIWWAAALAGVGACFLPAAGIVALLGVLVATRHAPWRTRLVRLAEAGALAGVIFVASGVLTHAITPTLRSVWTRTAPDSFGFVSLVHHILIYTFHGGPTVWLQTYKALMLAGLVLLAWTAAVLLRYRWERSWAITVILVVLFVLLSPSTFEFNLVLPLALLAVSRQVRVERAVAAGAITMMVVCMLMNELYVLNGPISLFAGFSAAIAAAWVLVHRGRVMESLTASAPEPDAVVEEGSVR